MNSQEKTLCIGAILFAICLVAALIFLPELRELSTLIPLVGVGLAVNVTLAFLVLRDIFARSFPRSTDRYLWIFLILFCWPAIPIYLVRHGFRPRIG